MIKSNKTPAKPLRLNNTISVKAHKSERIFLIQSSADVMFARSINKLGQSKHIFVLSFLSAS